MPEPTREEPTLLKPERPPAESIRVVHRTFSGDASPLAEVLVELYDRAVAREQRKLRDAP